MKFCWKCVRPWKPQHTDYSNCSFKVCVYMYMYVYMLLGTQYILYVGHFLLSFVAACLDWSDSATAVCLFVCLFV